MLEAFANYLEHSPDAVAVLDGRETVAYANKSFDRLFGRGNGSARGAGLGELSFSSECAETLAARLSGARREGGQAHFVLRDQIQGEQRQFTCRIMPGAAFGMEREALLLEMRDCTELDRLRRALAGGRTARRKEEAPDRSKPRNFFSVLDEFPAFVYMQRQDYTVAYANKLVRDLYGETESRLCYEVFAGRDSPCPVCPTFDVFETGRSVEWEFVDDQGRTFRIYDYPFEDEAGELLVMELGIDVTDLKRVEKELFEAQKLRAIGVLAGGLAHDLNNNLVPIIFNIDHALNHVGREETRGPLEEALHAAYRAAKLVEQVLEYSRQQEVKRSALHLKPLAEECLKTFSDYMGEDIKLDADLGARRDCVRANTGQMQQVMMNLLRNAEQAMPEGGAVTFRLGEARIESQTDSPHPELGRGEYVSISVGDTGHGIGPHEMDRIFEPFYTTKKKQGGTGMGLAVVHSIVTSCGGAIQVDSEPGAGALFTLYLPRCSPPATPLAAEFNTVQGGGNRLLLVDDDQTALAAMARTLRNAGFDVDTASSGEEGLKRFAKSPERYGLVLADQSMPGMNGVEMSAAILAQKGDARIVICTGHVELALEQKAMGLGVAGFIMKPMRPSSLVECARRHCAG